MESSLLLRLSCLQSSIVLQLTLVVQSRDSGSPSSPHSPSRRTVLQVPVDTTTMEQRADSSGMSSGAKALHANAAAFVPPSSLKATAPEYTPPFRKEILGAVVDFGPGGTVVSINLPTDSSSVQVRSTLPAFPFALEKPKAPSSISELKTRPLSQLLTYFSLQTHKTLC